MDNPISLDPLNDLIAQGVAAGSQSAIANALLHDIPLVIWRDGHIVEVPPSELRLPPYTLA